MAAFKLTPHAAAEAARRGIMADQFAPVLERPEQVVPAAGGRLAYQSRITAIDGRMKLIRAIVEKANDELTVVTIYQTSKIAKYWRGP